VIKIDFKYYPRIIESELENWLSSTGGVVIEGPKVCGKTTTARRFAESEVLLDVDEEAREAVKVDPTLVLEGETPRLIDEWQLAPDLWNHIRRTIDERSNPGQFILAGSATPTDDITRHSGAGRLRRIQMRTMSLYERENSSGEISLSQLLDGQEQRCSKPEMSVRELAELTSIGGWPVHLGLEINDALETVRGYIDEIRRVDVSQVDERTREPQKVALLMKSFARNVTTAASLKTLATDTGRGNGEIHPDTVRDYLGVLKRLKIVENQPAWAPHLRSKVRLRKKPRHHFVDPSLSAAALDAGPERLLDDLEFFGLLFESLVIRDLRIYAQPLGGTVYYYRDETGLEVDAVVETNDGRWGAFEVKLGPGRIDEGAENLLDFVEKVDTDKCGQPAVLGVIVGKGTYGRQREDGVAVLPIASLGP